MKWFKHMTDASRDDKLVSLHATHGWAGVGRWWHIVERVGEQYKSGEPRATFHFGRLALDLELRREKFRSYLEVIQELSLISYTITEELLIISIPNIQKIKDNYLSDLEATSKRLPSKEVEEEEEEEDNQKNSSTTSLKMAESVVIKFPVAGKIPEWGLPVSLHETFSMAFPNVDRMAEYKKAIAWLSANHKKTPRGMPRFLNHWLERAQNGKHGLSSHQEDAKKAARAKEFEGMKTATLPLTGGKG